MALTPLIRAHYFWFFFFLDRTWEYLVVLKNYFRATYGLPNYAIASHINLSKTVFFIIIQLFNRNYIFHSFLVHLHIYIIDLLKYEHAIHKKFQSFFPQCVCKTIFPICSMVWLSSVAAVYVLFFMKFFFHISYFVKYQEKFWKLCITCDLCQCHKYVKQISRKTYTTTYLWL